MAGELQLPLAALQGDASNPPQRLWTTNKRPYLAFDSGTDEIAFVTFRVPDNFASAPVLIFQWSPSSGSAPGASVDAVRWACEVMVVTPDVDSAAMDADGYDAANEIDDEADNTNAKALKEASLALTNDDSIAAGDYVALKIYRNADHANDTLAEDAWLWSLTFGYTES